MSSCSSKQDLKPSSAIEKEEQKKVKEAKAQALQKKIQNIAEDYNLPALHTYLLERDEVAFEYFQGTRTIEKKISVTENDEYYLGKNTKILTSILVAQLIDQKVIDWSTPLSEIVGKDFNINPQLRSITIEMLLAQRSGLKPLEKLKVWNTLQNHSPRRGRELLVQSVLSYDPEFTPGSKTDTNSSSYVVLGWVLEKLTNFQWEELAKNKIIFDTGITRCHFGPLVNTKSESIDNPLGHTLHQLNLISVKSYPIPLALAPAESLSCSVRELGKLMKEINLGLYGSSSLLQEQTFTKLLGPTQDPKMTYAHFQVHNRVWAGGKTLTASSLDSLFTSHIVLAPAREMVFIVVVNSGTPKAREGAAKILKILTESVQ